MRRSLAVKLLLLAMLCLTASLICFLREVLLSASKLPSKSGR